MSVPFHDFDRILRRHKPSDVMDFHLIIVVEHTLYVRLLSPTAHFTILNKRSLSPVVGLGRKYLDVSGQTGCLNMEKGWEQGSPEPGIQ